MSRFSTSVMPNIRSASSLLHVLGRILWQQGINRIRRNPSDHPVQKRVPTGTQCRISRSLILQRKSFRIGPMWSRTYAVLPYRHNPNTNLADVLDPYFCHRRCQNLQAHSRNLPPHRNQARPSRSSTRMTIGSRMAMYTASSPILNSFLCPPAWVVGTLRLL